MRIKLALGFGLVALALFVLSIMIGRLIRTRGEEYSRTVLSQQSVTSTTIPFQRGTIMDRNQTVLAASEQVFNLILDPSVLNQGKAEQIERDKAATVEALSAVFGYPAQELSAALEANPTSAYLRYAMEISRDKKEAFEEYQEQHNNDRAAVGEVRGVWFESEYKRVYPYDTLACTVLGFSGKDSSRGTWGLEQYYNDYLTGTNGRSFGYMNQDGVVERITKEAKNGATIISTIDYTVQRIVENAIAEFISDKKVENVGVVVMDPKNAEILAMATNAVYDPNEPLNMAYMYSPEEIAEYEREGNEEARVAALNNMWNNYTIHNAFEPGSTTKTFTVAAALEENLADPVAFYDCDGGQQVADRYIRCSHTHGGLTVAEALGYSCNDVMMQLARKMGVDVFTKYMSLFGIGKKTGIDLAGEVSGVIRKAGGTGVRKDEQMSSVDLATNSFGQNFTATMVQVAAGYCSVLNGGSYYKPHIVKEIISADGEVIREVGSSMVRETVSESTAEILKEGLLLAVNDKSGTGNNAKITGYTVAGKTGTAEKLIKQDGIWVREEGHNVVSFIGFTPVESPELLVYVVVDDPWYLEDPLVHYNVKDSAVPLEQTIMSSLLEYLNVTPATVINSSGEEVAATPETDAEGHIVGAIEPMANDRNTNWEELVPAGGFVDGEEGALPEGEDEEESLVDPDTLDQVPEAEEDSMGYIIDDENQE